MVVAYGDSDMPLRRAGWQLLAQGLVAHVDVVDRAELLLVDGYREKMRNAGRVLTMVVPRKQVQAVLRALRAAYDGTALRSYAVPVIAMDED